MLVRRKFLCAGLAAAVTLVACATGPATAPAPKPASTQTQAGVDGYRRVVKDGQELFCRQEDVLGSRVQRGEVCQTVAQIENSRRNTDTFLRNVQSAIGSSQSTTPSATGR
jgi:hypothetical protein